MRPAIRDTVIHRHSFRRGDPILIGRITEITTDRLNGRPLAVVVFASGVGATVPVEGLIRPWPRSMPGTWLFTDEGVDWVGCSEVDSR